MVDFQNAAWIRRKMPFVIVLFAFSSVACDMVAFSFQLMGQSRHKLGCTPGAAKVTGLLQMASKEDSDGYDDDYYDDDIDFETLKKNFEETKRRLMESPPEPILDLRSAPGFENEEGFLASMMNPRNLDPDVLPFADEKFNAGPGSLEPVVEDDEEYMRQFQLSESLRGFLDTAQGGGGGGDDGGGGLRTARGRAGGEADEARRLREEVFAGEEGYLASSPEWRAEMLGGRAPTPAELDMDEDEEESARQAAWKKQLDEIIASGPPKYEAFCPNCELGTTKEDLKKFGECRNCRMERIIQPDRALDLRYKQQQQKEATNRRAGRSEGSKVQKTSTEGSLATGRQGPKDMGAQQQQQQQLERRVAALEAELGALRAQVAALLAGGAAQGGGSAPAPAPSSPAAAGAGAGAGAGRPPAPVPPRYNVRDGTVTLPVAGGGERAGEGAASSRGGGGRGRPPRLIQRRAAPPGGALGRSIYDRAPRLLPRDEAPAKEKGEEGRGGLDE